MSEKSASRFNELFTGGGILFLGLATEMLISLFSKVIIARYLGKVDYGGIALGVTVVAMVSTLVLAGIHTGVARFLPRFDDSNDRKGIIWSALLIVGGLSIVAALILLVFADLIAKRVFDDASLAPIFVVFAVAIPLSALMRLAIGVSQGYQVTFLKVLTRNVSFPIIRFLGAALVIILGLGRLGIAGAYVVAYAVGAGFGFWYIVTRTDFSVSLPDRYRASTLMSFSAPLLLSAALTLALSDIDTLMLGYFSSQAKVGTYNVVYPIAVLLLAFLRSFRFLFLPKISEFDSKDNHEEMSRQYYLVTKWIFFTTSPIFAFIIVYPDQIIGFLFGMEYANGSPALIVLTVGFYVHAVLGLNGTTLTSIGRTRLILADNFVAATVNILCNLWLIPRYGFIGAAIATTVSYLMINIIYSLQLYRIRSIQPVSYKLVLAVGLLLVLVQGWVKAKTILSDSLMSIILLSMVFSICYLIMVLSIMGVESEEFALARSLEDQIQEKINVFRGQ